MFNKSKYTKWYFNIIENARIRKLRIGYYEKHHIIPKSLGGIDRVDNIINLTAREHFICHLLLIKMVTNKNAYEKMVHSAWFFQGNQQNRELKINNRIYEALRIKKSNIQTGKKQSKESIEKRVKKILGKKRTKEQCYNIALAVQKFCDDHNTPEYKIVRSNRAKDGHKNMTLETYNRMIKKQSLSAKNKPPMSHQTKEKCAAFHRGKKRSENTRKKMSIARLGREIPKPLKEKKIIKWKIINDKNEQFISYNLIDFINEYNISSQSKFYKSYNSGCFIDGFKILEKTPITVPKADSKQRKIDLLFKDNFKC